MKPGLLYAIFVRPRVMSQRTTGASSFLAGLIYTSTRYSSRTSQRDFTGSSSGQWWQDPKLSAVPGVSKTFEDDARRRKKLEAGTRRLDAVASVIGRQALGEPSGSRCGGRGASRCGCAKSSGVCFLKILFLRRVIFILGWREGPARGS